MATYHTLRYVVATMGLVVLGPLPGGLLPGYPFTGDFCRDGLLPGGFSPEGILPGLPEMEELSRYISWNFQAMKSTESKQLEWSKRLKHSLNCLNLLIIGIF